MDGKSVLFSKKNAMRRWLGELLMCKVSRTLVPIFTAILIYYYENLVPKDDERFHFDDPVLNDSYDFIIVGAGSAGSVVAHRLAENCGWTVLLVESGGEEDVISETPLLAAALWNTDKDWNFTTVRQKVACQEFDGYCQYPRGHVLGGSSSINFMMYVRGNKIDFDYWESQGNKGWSYEDVLPYFLKSENMTVPELQDSPYHATGGQLSVEGQRYCSPLEDSYIKAAKEIGLTVNKDYNGESQIGVACPQITSERGSRCSASRAFLSPIKNKRNIHIAKGTFVEAINLSEANDKATGIKIKRNGKTIDVEAKKEVIVSAGAINTPQLLMLSGIGPMDHLSKLGIQPRVDLPVGKGLMDHCYISTYFKINTDLTMTKKKISSLDEIDQYNENKTGALASSYGISVMTHFHLNGCDPKVPDIQSYFIDFFSYQNDESIIQLSFAKLRPLSLGSVRLRSCDPLEIPLIDPNYLGDAKDFSDSVLACLVLLKMAKTDSLAQYDPQPYTPIDCCRGKENEEYCECLVKYHSKTMFHPTSSARMASNDKDGVVNSDLMVWGVSNLRVIDASVMPNVTSGNTNAPTIMIAEKGADIIKKRWS